MFWINPNLPYIVDHSIGEYDIKSGNVSIMKCFKDRFAPPLKDDQIDQIAALDKNARVIRVGNMMRDIPKFSETLEKGFNEVVYRFCEENHLDMTESTEDIVSIKRDAVFVVDKPIIKDRILQYCHFVKKNEYDGYIHIPGYEFYIDSHANRIDVKGMQDDKLEFHKDGILQLILDLYQECKSTNLNRYRVSKWLEDFCDAYLSRDLPFDYYRQFDSNSKFKMNMGSMEYFSDQIEEEDMEDLDIEYNYRKIIIPLLNVFI